MKRWAFAMGCVSVCAMACSGRGVSPTAPSAGSDRASTVAVGASSQSTAAEEPPFNLEAILRGDGDAFGLVKFRQEQDPTRNIVTLDVWVRDLLANTSYSLQRAVDATLDGVCTSTTWLTLGDGLTPHPIVTDETGTARASLFRDLSAFAPGATFDIHFRLIENSTGQVALQSDCYRFVVRN
jgi:hypothetical protein